jgi:hypothetical protein
MENIPYPNPSLPTPRAGTFIPSSTAAPEFVFETEVLFSEIQFWGQKADGVDNVGDVDIYIRDEDNAYVYWDSIPPGVKINWAGPPDGPRFTKRSFQVKSNTTGDGIRYNIQ